MSEAFQAAVIALALLGAVTTIFVAAGAAVKVAEGVRYRRAVRSAAPCHHADCARPGVAVVVAAYGGVDTDSDPILEEFPACQEHLAEVGGQVYTTSPIQMSVRAAVAPPARLS